jgi:hypothetical protein
MKPFTLTPYVLLLLIIVLASCGEKKEQTSETTDGEQKEESQSWKEMDEFHMVMAETFHPYKDSSDLQPVKTKAGELVAAADQWVSAPLPEKVNNDEMKTSLQELKTETEVLRDIVQTGDDQKIGTQLTKLHDKFHEIQEAWYGGHGHGHEH